MTDSETDRPLVGRRTFLWGAALAAAGPIVSEASLAYAARASFLGAVPPDAVLINANENPLGPSKAACQAIADIASLGGRYDRWDETDKVIGIFARQQNLKPENVALYAGSSEPLHYSGLAFTSPTRSLVMADPSYESPAAAARVQGAVIHKVPLTADYAHDVRAMVAADPGAGLIYICNPNNPTGTVTPRDQILWALEHKPAGAVLLVDEAYIHLSDETTVMDQVAAGKDLIVLRTFSKVYGMAGIRCGMAIARPDLLEKLQAYFQNMMPVTALVAARASLDDPDLVPVRKKIIGDIRVETISWLKAHGYDVIGQSHSNCFMIDTGRDGQSVVNTLRGQNIYIGRIWPVWPHAVRITVGLPEEMARFRVAFKDVMDRPAMASLGPARPDRAPRGADGATFLS